MSGRYEGFERSLRHVAGDKGRCEACHMNYPCDIATTRDEIVRFVRAAAAAKPAASVTDLRRVLDKVVP